MWESNYKTCSTGIEIWSIFKLQPFHLWEKRTNRVYLESKQQEEGFNTVETSVNKVTHEEIICLWDIATNLSGGKIKTSYLKVVYWDFYANQHYKQCCYYFQSDRTCIMVDLTFVCQESCSPIQTNKLNNRLHPTTRCHDLQALEEIKNVSSR